MGPAPAPHPSPSLIWGKKEEIAVEGRKVGSARKINPLHPPALGLGPSLIFVSSVRACHKLSEISQKVARRLLFVTKVTLKAIPNQAKLPFLFLSCFIWSHGRIGNLCNKS